MKRRQFINSSLLVSAGLSAQASLPAWAQSGVRTSLYNNTVLAGTEFDLSIGEMRSKVAGKTTKQIVVNDQFPAPLLRWKEGEEVTLRVTNTLDVDTSIHWHGILLPYQMDGVPGLSYSGIKPGETYTYRFPVKQAGTYWYHSHSGFQEQQGLYGPIIIDPASSGSVHVDPVSYDREYVLVLSDWTYENPDRLFSKLKKMGDSFNYQRRTVGDFFRDVKEQGLKATFDNRAMWGAMRMNPADIADVTGATYTYLLNGQSADENWTGLFQSGERVRLRFINASAMSIFNIRIPGLPMTVVQADGLNVQPVETDEFQIGTAETFDVVVSPKLEDAYTIFCESNDRSGYVRGTLTVEEGLEAVVPALRERPLLTMRDMGMSDHNMNMVSVEHSSMDQGEMNHSAMDNMQIDHSTNESNGMEMGAHPHNHFKGPGVMNLAMNPVSRLHESPLGLENQPHRVLVYADLRSLEMNPDHRLPEREMELHLTGNMERYMWSFDGQKYSEVHEPIPFELGERVRLTMVSDTMMPHPVHLHGMFFDVVREPGMQVMDHHKVRKHTIVIKPGEKLSVDITADAEGLWAFHCHLLYHMHAGMMRAVSVRRENRHENLAGGEV